MDQPTQLCLDAIGRVTANHEYRLKQLEANQAQPESGAIGCSADGRRASEGESGVPPACPSQTLERLEANMRMHYSWHLVYRDKPNVTYEELKARICEEYEDMLRIIEGEVG